MFAASSGTVEYMFAASSGTVEYMFAVSSENFDIGNMGEPALKSHMKSAKHQQMVKLRSKNHLASFIVRPSVSSVLFACMSVAATTTVPSTNTV